MGNLGLGEIILIFFFVIFYGALILIPVWAIAKKAGYQPVLSLLAMIPIVNLIVLYIFAFSKWPNLRDSNSPA